MKTQRLTRAHAIQQVDSKYHQDWSPSSIEMDSQAIIRMVPYQDEVTGTFYTEAKIHNLIVRDAEGQDLKLRIPSGEQYDWGVEEYYCPMTNVVRAAYKEAKGLENTDPTAAARIKSAASTHWIKYTRGVVAFIIGGVTDADPNEPVVIRLSPQMFKPVKQAIKSSDTCRYLPSGTFAVKDCEMLVSNDDDMLAQYITDEGLTSEQFDELFMGHDYFIRKTQQGEHNNYDSSSFRGDATPITPEQAMAIAENGIPDTRAKLIPPKPTHEALELGAALMEASINYELGSGEPVEWTDEIEEAMGGDIKPTPPDEDGYQSPTTGGALGRKFGVKPAPATTAAPKGSAERTQETLARINQR